MLRHLVAIVLADRLPQFRSTVARFRGQLPASPLPRSCSTAKLTRSIPGAMTRFAKQPRAAVVHHDAFDCGAKVARRDGRSDAQTALGHADGRPFPVPTGYGSCAPCLSGRFHPAEAFFPTLFPGSMSRTSVRRWAIAIPFCAAVPQHDGCGVVGKSQTGSCRPYCSVPRRGRAR